MSRSAVYFDTLITVTLYGTEDPSLIDGCFELCKGYEKTFSRTDEGSELYALNHSDSMEASPELLELLSTALSYCDLSGGCFDITLGAVSDLYGFSSESPGVPEKRELEEALSHVGREHVHILNSIVSKDDKNTVIDLGAIAKGYIADGLAAYLKENGQKSAVIDLGGNILCVGSRPDGNDFTVGIRSPFDKTGNTIANIKASDRSVVTSGVYERSFEKDGVLYHHILDPQTGYPYHNGLVSVSIVSERSTDGDALSTVCFTMGLEKGMALINSLDGIEALFVTSDGELHYSDGFEAFLI